MTVDMVAEAMISKEEGITRVSPNQIDELLHPRLDIEEEKSAPVIAKVFLRAGRRRGGGFVFTADDAETWAKDGKKVILVREETSPEDVHGMHAAEAIFNCKGRNDIPRCLGGPRVGKMLYCRLFCFEY